MKISIIIPTYNEERYISELLEYIHVHTQKRNIEEIIVVDSFSTDNTVKVAEKAHAKLYLSKPRDTKTQMEIGAFQAKADVLYFIKPGCFPPPHFDERILHAVKTKYMTGIIGKKRWTGRLYLSLNKFFSCFNSKLAATHIQTVFIMRGAFHFAGGFHNHDANDAFADLLIRANSMGYKMI